MVCNYEAANTQRRCLVDVEGQKWRVEGGVRLEVREEKEEAARGGDRGHLEEVLFVPRSRCRCVAASTERLHACVRSCCLHVWFSAHRHRVSDASARPRPRASGVSTS